MIYFVKITKIALNIIAKYMTEEPNWHLTNKLQAVFKIYFTL